MKWWTEVKYNWYYTRMYIKVKAARIVIVVIVFGLFVVAIWF